MKTKTYIVLNPKDCTYNLFKADSIESLMKTLGVNDVEENGTYIGYNSPEYQVIDSSKVTIFDLRQKEVIEA